MRATRWRRQRGLTLLEFTLITMIISALVAFALQRISSVSVYMERAAIDYSVARMRESLALEFAEMVVEGRLGQLPGGEDLNPLAREVVVENYAGARALPAASRREPGQWYYDPAIESVVYVPRYPQALRWPEGEPRVLRWRAVARWHDADGDGEFDRGSDRVTSLELVRRDEAQWR
ncbi:MAG: prepilin-type N-terminal cleavage/methylation domain-containing protein [Halofilum sp. (in: g-proteobacteria)]|nr:prepilin-type N-terminal cleavage/methylation domain-containing protein [Halofilum sp. (in: g-proteobacteria)]